MKSPGEKFIFIFKDGSIKGPLLPTHSTLPILKIKMCILTSNFLWHAELRYCFIKEAHLESNVTFFGECSKRLLAGLIALSVLPVAVLKLKDAHQQSFI